MLLYMCNSLCIYIYMYLFIYTHTHLGSANGASTRLERGGGRTFTIAWANNHYDSTITSQ